MVITDFKTTYFQFERLTPIDERPDFQSLTKLKNEIKANAQAVPSTLGGGAHGLLGLVLTDPEYALVSNVPFVAEPYPGPLTFPPGTNSLQSKILQDAYDKRLRDFETCDAVSKALVQQIVKAVHEDWLQPLRNATTNSLQGTIPNILDFLFQAHGDVSPDALTKKEALVKAMHYDPASDPVDNVFTAVTKLVDFAVAAGAPYSRPQTINIAYCILKRSKVFNKAITEWNRKIRANPNQATWVTFKTHFRTAYTELQEVEELTVAETTFNQANPISEIVGAVQESFTLDTVPTPISASTPPTPHQLNAAVSSPPSDMTAIMQQMMQMNQQMLQSMQTMQQSNTSSSPSSGYYRQGSGGRGGGRNRNRSRGGGGRGRGTRSRVMRYCWSCGWCTHDGTHCRFPKEGHCETATFDNRMGGSNDGFPPSPTNTNV